MEYFNKIVCVTYEELTSGAAPVIKPGTLKSLQYRKRVDVISRGGGEGNPALYVYSSLPSRYRICFERKYGDPVELIKENNMKDKIKMDSSARLFFEKYVLPDGTHLPVEKIEEYTTNASVLNELVLELNDRKGYRKALGGSTQRTWETIIGTTSRLRESYGHTLPENAARLKEKINRYKREGYACLISRKFCNKNTTKITPEAGRYIVALKRSRVPIRTNEQIFREFNRVAHLHDWKQLRSINTLVQYLNRPEVEPLWYDAVFGELAARQRYGRKHKTKLPECRDALWYSDGTKLNLYYKAFDDKGKLQVRTTQVYEVMDAYSEVFLGYHISDSENFVAQYNAFRMAIETARHKPYEIVNDNQGGHKKLTKTGFLDSIATKISRRTAPYNGNSKTIENAFYRFQAEILHQDWRFTGQNITAKQETSRPNLEFIEANKENLYTLEELKTAYAKARKEWNNAKHPATGIARIEMYQNSVNPESVEVNTLDMIDMFWIRTERPSTFTSSGITIQVNKREYTYEVLDAKNMPDMDFRRKHTGRKFYTVYDPLDMTTVRLYEDTASGVRYVATAHPYIEVHRAMQEQSDGELSFIRKQEWVNKQERISRQLAAAELEMAFGVAPEQHGLCRPRLKGINPDKVEDMMMDAYSEPESSSDTTIDIGAALKEISNRTFDFEASYGKL